MQVILIIYSLFGFIIIEVNKLFEILKDPVLVSPSQTTIRCQIINHLTNPPFFRFGMV